MSDFLKKVMQIFTGSFINANYELILIKNTNLYFSLKDVKNDIDLKCKIIEWCSRDACKSQPYIQNWRNKKYNDGVLKKINTILETNFSQNEMMLIYTKLGNGVHHQLTIDFILNDYNLNLLS